MKLKGYIEGTQRGYAYGLAREDGQRVYEQYTHTADYTGLPTEAQRANYAYQEARRSLSLLEHTAKTRPGLIPDQSADLPGKLYD